MWHYKDTAVHIFLLLEFIMYKNNSILLPAAVFEYFVKYLYFCFVLVLCKLFV
jgi:hypothetical protein